MQTLEQVITDVLRKHEGVENTPIGEGGCPRISWYGLRLEMIEAITAWNTRPTAPVEVLDRYNLNASFDGPGDAFCAAVKSKKGVFVRFDQAEAIIAAKDERISELEELLRISESCNHFADNLSKEMKTLETDNAALTARVKELEAVNAKLCDDAIDCELKIAERDVSLKALETQLAALKDAAKSVEKWWLSEGMNHFPGAPYCIFAIRAALEAKP